ncbi:MAG: PQQ-binding-like beta-propeller repeat protein [Actinomycetota bacterium]|nr:PQQ-binding-like beta-propeller repeat protein [Actinomycetota bacterium]
MRVPAIRERPRFSGAPRPSSPRIAAAIALVISTCWVTIPLAGASTSTAPSTEWWGYHGGADGAGIAADITGFNTSTPRWRSPLLDGSVYGEPLVAEHEVIVATENDSVYALSTNSGAVLWRRHLGAPVPANTLPCGDISPDVGITGTPVIDLLRHEVFVLDFEARAVPVHFLVGLDLATGDLMTRVALPTPSADQRTYLSRSALTLSHGDVVYSFGGNYGDCGNYHGVVGTVAESAPHRIRTFVVDARPGQREGAVWMGGAAPAVDAAGDVWVTTGNGSVTSPRQPYDHSDAVLELSPQMKLRGFFAPSTWYQDNAADADLSSEPALMGHNLVVATGKAGRIYLLDTRRLGGIGGQIAEIDSRCGDVLDGGVAINADTLFLPCAAGTEAARVTYSPATIRVIWHAQAGAGPPIMAGHRVWTIGADGILYGLNPATGAVLQRVSLGVEDNHFATPSVGAGLLLAPLARGVVAFAAD